MLRLRVFEISITYACIFERKGIHNTYSNFLCARQYATMIKNVYHLGSGYPEIRDRKHYPEGPNFQDRLTIYLENCARKKCSLLLDRLTSRCHRSATSPLACQKTLLSQKVPHTCERRTSPGTGAAFPQLAVQI